MPEGPSIMHLRDELLPFKNKVVKNAGGYGKMPTAWINGKKLLDVTTWGKHLLLIFSNGTVRVHLGLFGDVVVDERKKVNRSFYLEFAKGEINGYVVKAQKIEKPLKEVYDWRNDILSEKFSAAYVKGLIKKHEKKTIGDVLMDQEVFSGVGNIIRNESLYYAGIHPLSITGKIPAAKISKLIKEVEKFAHHWYGLMKKGKRLTMAVYQEEHAPDGSEVTMKVLPKSKRKVFFSTHKQTLYK